MKKAAISLKDYIEAMSIVNQYESQLEKPEGNGSGVCRCSKCKLKFGFTREQITKEDFRGGTYYYQGKCPYCNSEILLMTY